MGTKKKTALRPRNHRATSSRKQTGLIAQEKNRMPSAGTKSALDNRSHRTARKSAAGEPLASSGMPNVAGSHHAHEPMASFETYAPDSSISLLDANPTELARTQIFECGEDRR